MTSFAVRLTLLAGLGTFAFAAPAAAAFVSGTPETHATKAPLMQLAQGVTPEGWRKEGAPRYKKGANRQAAMERCISVVGKEYPNSETQTKERTGAYMACMTKAGQAP